MLPLYIFALLIHAAISSTPCKDGVEIISRRTNNPEDLIGNWTYVYHWDNVSKRVFLHVNDYSKRCPEIFITVITPDYVKQKEAECAGNKVPFKWSDAKLRLDAPLMKMKGGIVLMGEKENWIILNCVNMSRFVMNKVSDDNIVLIDPDEANVANMIVRKAPTLEELKCVAHNVDLGKGVSGFRLCN